MNSEQIFVTLFWVYFGLPGLWQALPSIQKKSRTVFSSERSFWCGSVVALFSPSFSKPQLDCGMLTARFLLSLLRRWLSCDSKEVSPLEDLFKHDDIHNLPQSQASYSCFWFCKETKGNEAVDFVTSFFTFSALPHFANRCKGSYFLHCVALVSVIVHDLQEAGFWGSECHNTTMEVPNHVRHSRLPELSLKAIGESPLRRSQRRGETEGADMPTAAIWPFGAISTNLLSARLWWHPSDMLKFDHWEA